MTWVYSPRYGKNLFVAEEKSLWGEKLLKVIIPDEKRIENIPSGEVISLEQKESKSKDHIIYSSCAAKIADSIGTDMVISPFGGNLIPLPHQLNALTKVLSGDMVRFLLADEVGLGKTIEAGMIFKELKIRGLVKRVLIVAPKGLVLQWVGEMKKHFNETFNLIIPGKISPDKLYTVLTDSGEEIFSNRLNYWKNFDQVICSMDSVKPLEKRKGWSEEEIERYNRERFDNLLQAGWDLIIIDESHRMAGSSHTVSRHTLGRNLAYCSPYLLLLSATPHSGKSDSFRRLMSLLDEEAFADEDSLTKERVSSYVIRTEKRNAIDFKGDKLFKPRTTTLHFISWENNAGRELYEAVTDYVSRGYNRAMREKNYAAGFLMVLFQKLLTSSTAAIRSTLEKRLILLNEQFDGDKEEILSEFLETDLMDETEVKEFYQTMRTAGIEEIEKIRFLVDLAKKCEELGPDAKTEALLELIYKFSSEEGNPELKFLIFTEFTATQKMLQKYLENRGFTVAILNGSLGLEERVKVQRDFAGAVRVLISTDAGGEGINLQFCHIIINYDIPWSPVKLEQRIGRVDRIGQIYPVKAINFLLKDTVESRVYEVLQWKLHKIAEEFGVDKTSDILDSSEAESEFRNLYINAIVNPAKLDEELERVTEDLLERAKKAKEKWDIVHGGNNITNEEAERILGIPLPYWVERMVTGYLISINRKVEKTLFGYNLIWEDGEVMENITFSADEGSKGLCEHLTLENAKVMKLVKNLPLFVQGEKVPSVYIKELPSAVKGYWSLWKIVLSTAYSQKQRILPLFRQEDGKVFKPTARRLWDIFLTCKKAEVTGEIAGDEAELIYMEMEDLAVKNGEELYNELRDNHVNFLRKEKEKGEYAFNARRKAIERIGLPEVRNYRFRQLIEEKKIWEMEMKSMEIAVPEIYCIILCHVKGDAP